MGKPPGEPLLTATVVRSSRNAQPEPLLMDAPFDRETCSSIATKLWPREVPVRWTFIDFAVGNDSDSDSDATYKSEGSTGRVRRRSPSLCLKMGTDSPLQACSTPPVSYNLSPRSAKAAGLWQPAFGMPLPLPQQRQRKVSTFSAGSQTTDAGAEGRVAVDSCDELPSTPVDMLGADLDADADCRTALDSSDDEDDDDDDACRVVCPIFSEDADLPSQGSAGHGSGTCKRCCFFPKGRCNNGFDCQFCHFAHERRPPAKKKKKAKRKKPRKESADTTQPQPQPQDTVATAVETKSSTTAEARPSLVEALGAAPSSEPSAEDGAAARTKAAAHVPGPHQWCWTAAALPAGTRLYMPNQASSSSSSSGAASSSVQGPVMVQAMMPIQVMAIPFPHASLNLMQNSFNHF